MVLKIEKVRDVKIKLVEDNSNIKTLDNSEIEDMVIRLMSENLTDEEGNKCISDNVQSGDILVRITENHFQKLREDIINATKNENIEEIKKVKTEAFPVIQDMIKKYNIENVNISEIKDIFDNIENYLGRVEVLTITRRRVYNAFENKEEEMKVITQKTKLINRQ